MSSGTAWIQSLRKAELIAVCAANNLEHNENETVDQLRAKVREHVRKQISNGKEKKALTGDGIEVEQDIPEYKYRMEFTANLDFDLKKDDWEKFVDRIEQYFEANDITDVKKKRAILLTKVNAETYDVIAKVCQPTKPKEKTFEEIVKLMTDHIKPPASYLVYRNEFRQRVQTEDESISEFVTALRTLTVNCKFTEAHKDDQILDQLICGLKSKAIKAELLKIDDLKLDSAIKKALASEAANKGADKLLHNKTSREELHKVSVFRGRGRPNQQRQRVTREVSTVSRRDRPNQGQIPAQQRQQGDTRSSVNRCYSCGMFGHWRNECRLRDSLICNLCKRRGHVDIMCQERRQTRTTNNDRKLNFVNACEGHNDLDNKSDTAESDEDDLATNDKTYGLYNLKYVSGKKMVKPQFMPVKINGININMEIDSGAAMSVIPMKLKEKYFHNIIMYKPDIEFVNHDESICKPVGMFKNVQIEANNCKLRTDVYVTKSSSPPIIGRSWLEAVNLWPLYKELELHSVETTSNNKRLQAILSSHKRFFESNKGIFTKGSIKLELKEGVTPKYVKARSVPFALEKKIEKELNRLVDEGVLEPVETSEWATPIVPIMKPNGDVRLCADYKVTVNPHLKTVRYAPPNFDHAIARLQTRGYNKNKKKKYSKLDLKDAFLQVPVDKNSQQIMTINTHKGLFRCRFMMYGIASGPGYFQKQIEEILTDLKNVAIVADDVIVTGDDDEDHLRNLDRVLTRLEQCGLKGRVEKCNFFKDEVSYLGYKLSNGHISIDEEKYKAIAEMKKPENHKDLQLLLGKVNYYGRLFKNRVETLAPLYKCMKSEHFNWNIDCEKAFTETKHRLKQIVTNYNSELPLILTCDASPLGLGAWISQPYPDGEKPVAFASTKLTKAQEKYSQIDREAAAVIFGITKFYDYLYAREFVLRIDNKPLSRIFSPEKGIPKMAASRLQNWSYFLSAFNYKVECIGTKDNIVADTLSRLPTNYVEQNEILDSVPSYSYLHYAIQSKITCLDHKAVARETSKDKVLSLVKRMVTNGWPERKINAWTEELKPYALRRDELSTEKECLMWGQRVIIPSKLRSDIIEKLHESHFSVVRMKSMARSVVWWPKIDSHIEERVKTCKYCIEVNDSPRRMTLSPWPYPTQPWHRIHADFAGPFLGHTFLLILDAFSKWPEIYIVNNMSAELTIKLFKDAFLKHGLPHHVITDSGTQFTSDEFKSFLKSIGTKHTFAAPKHPATNGAAENFVKVFKRKIKAIMNSSNIDIQTATRRFLFNYRTTKHTITNETPAKLLMGREFRTTLDILRPDSKKIIELKQEDQIKNFIGNRNEKFQQNDVVMARDFRKYHPKMSEATIIQDLSPRSCMVKFKDGEEHKRHYDQMRKWKKTSFKNKNAKNQNGGMNAQESEGETGTRKSVRVRKSVERYNATG